MAATDYIWNKHSAVKHQAEVVAVKLLTCVINIYKYGGVGVL